MSIEEKEIKFAERTKPSRGDSQPEPATGAPEPAKQKQQQTVQLRPFQDGAVLKHSINPRNPATRVIHDATGTPLSVCLFPDIAELICNAVTFLFHEQARFQREAQKNLDVMSEAAVVAEADGGTAAGQEAKPFVPVAAPEIAVLPEPNNNGTPTETP